MASPRHNQTLRGSRIVSSPSKPPAAVPEEPEFVADPQRPRQVVSYAMQRRAALQGLIRGGLREDICDADPMLLRTAKYHGEASARDCPVCRKHKLTLLTYTFGNEMGELSGRVRAQQELAELAYEYGSFRVYVVEVCQRCTWNHLVMSYVLGDGVPRMTTGKRRQK